jgi:hypothetical protein
MHRLADARGMFVGRRATVIRVTVAPDLRNAIARVVLGRTPRDRFGLASEKSSPVKEGWTTPAT